MSLLHFLKATFCKAEILALPPSIRWAAAITSNFNTGFGHLLNLSFALELYLESKLSLMHVFTRIWVLQIVSCWFLCVVWDGETLLFARPDTKVKEVPTRIIGFYEIAYTTDVSHK